MYYEQHGAELGPTKLGQRCRTRRERRCFDV